MVEVTLEDLLESTKQNQLKSTRMKDVDIHFRRSWGTTETRRHHFWPEPNMQTPPEVQLERLSDDARKCHQSYPPPATNKPKHSQDSQFRRIMRLSSRVHSSDNLREVFGRLERYRVINSRDQSMW